MLASLPLRGLAALALALAATEPCVAQSGYALATLKPASAVQPPPSQRFFIDDGNRVVGRTEYDTGSYRWPMCIPWTIVLCSSGGRVYSGEVVAWPASSAASVEPVKIANISLPEGAGTAVDAASPNGRIVATTWGSYVFDTRTGALIGMTGQLRSPEGQHVSHPDLGPRAIDDSGLVVLSDHHDSYTWDLGPLLGRTTDVSIQTEVTLPQPLPKGPYRTSTVSAISGRQLFVGHVSGDVNWEHRPARWAHGVFEVLDAQRWGRAVGVNAAGQILMEREGRKFSVWFNGTETPIAPLLAGDVAIPSAINASGVVVGRMGRPSDGTTVEDACQNARAFIWRNGVTTDLNDWVKARGVKLPWGAVLEEAKDINDQGSLVAVMRSWTGTRSVVRLTARP